MTAQVALSEAPARSPEAPSCLPRLPGADGIRAVAMLGVFMVHVITVLGFEHPRWLMESCRMGTDLFLVLSGCLIHRSLRSEPAYGAFLRRRFLRIYPVFAFVLGTYLALLYPLLPEKSKLPADTTEAVLMMIGNAAIVPMAFGVKPVITVSWSLSYICLFYLLAPVLKRRIRSRSPRFQAITWAGITLLTFVTVGRAGLLPLGVVLSKVIERAPAPRWVLWLCVGAVARALPLPPGLRLAGASVAAFAFCWWALQHLPATEAFRSLSRFSYSFYLTHGVAILGIAALRLPVGIGMPLALISALAIATLVYWLIEEPLSPIARARQADQVSAKAPRRTGNGPVAPAPRPAAVPLRDAVVLLDQ